MTYLDESDMNAINSYHRSMDRAEAEHNRIVTTAMNMTLISAFEYLKYQYSEYEAIDILATELDAEKWEEDDLLAFFTLDDLKTFTADYDKQTDKRQKELVIKKHILANIFGVTLK